MAENPALLLCGCFYEIPEEGMCGKRHGFEFRMELACHKPRVIRKLDNLRKLGARIDPGKNHALFLVSLLIRGIELITVAVPLADFQ